MPRANSGNRSGKRGKPPRTYWRGSIGRDARLALRIMALQDAIAQRIEQDAAEAALIAKLIMDERARRLDTTIFPGLTVAQAEQMTEAEYDDWFDANREKLGI